MQTLGEEKKRAGLGSRREIQGRREGCWKGSLMAEMGALMGVEGGGGCLHWRQGRGVWAGELGGQGVAGTPCGPATLRATGEQGGWAWGRRQECGWSTCTRSDSAPHARDGHCCYPILLTGKQGQSSIHTQP